MGSQRDTPGAPHKNERDDLLLREQVTQLQEAVRELQHLPAPGQLLEDLERAPQTTDASHCPSGEPIRGFGDLLKRFEAKH